MKKLINEMIQILKTLKASHGATAIKTSFETENIQLFELLRIVEMASGADVGLVFKLGGSEALTDIRLAKMVGASAILGPMIETSFSLEKYLELCRHTFSEDDDVKYLINIETVDGCKNIEEILSVQNINKLDTVVLGRTDLCNSLNLNDVNSPEVLTLAKDLFAKLKRRSIRCLVGGGITTNTIPFFKKLNGLIDGFETMKIVFGNFKQAESNLEKSIQLALQYELKWYLLKQKYYNERYLEDQKKISKISALLENRRMNDS